VRHKHVRARAHTHVSIRTRANVTHAPHARLVMPVPGPAVHACV